MTLCENANIKNVCNIRDCHEDGDEQAVTFCSDFIEIVRCEDCKYRYSPMNDDAHYCNLKYGLVGIVAEEDYCSYGKRRNESEK